MIWFIYALLMAIIFIILWFSYVHDLIVWKVIGYGFLFIVNAPLFIGSFSGVGIDYEVSCMIIENSTGIFQIPILETYSNNWFFLFLSIVGAYGTTLFAFDEYKFKKEQRERT